MEELIEDWSLILGFWIFEFMYFLLYRVMYIVGG